MEYYIHHIPVFLVGTAPPEVDVGEFCAEAEDLIPRALLENVDVVYIGDRRELQGRNASYHNGAIYMTDAEPTVEDMLENFVHEAAHAMEERFAQQIYVPSLIEEFKGKRRSLYRILTAQGYTLNPIHFEFTEYNEKFDQFLADEVGYPTLLTLTMGLFASPYAATSLQEYFANGVEKYFLESPRYVRKVSPVLHDIIEEIIS
jgi:hypothetical protein